MDILSPVAGGSGVEVLHHSLADAIPGYRINRHSPLWSLFPPALAGFSSNKVSLVHASADYGVFFKRRGVPLVATIHNYTSDRFMRAYSSRLQYLHYRSDLRLFTRLTLQTASAVVAISRFMADKVRDDLQVSRPIRLIYNGIDEQRFLPPRNRRRSQRFRVLFCGNLNRRKRADLLGPLAHALGKGFELQYTAGLSETSHKPANRGADAAEMRPLGRVAYADMPMVYADADVLFMPSVREGFGLCVAEAMASGLPVIACAESAIPELVVNQQGGYLCPIDDVACYAEAIQTLAGSTERARMMGEYNRARVEERFTLSRMVHEYRELFAEVADNARELR